MKMCDLQVKREEKLEPAELIQGFVLQRVL